MKGGSLTSQYMASCFQQQSLSPEDLMEQCPQPHFGWFPSRRGCSGTQSAHSFPLHGDRLGGLARRQRRKKGKVRLGKSFADYGKLQISIRINLKTTLFLEALIGGLIFNPILPMPSSLLLRSHACLPVIERQRRRR